MNHPSSLIHRWFFCVGSMLCLLGLVHCTPPNRPCSSENKCADPQTPYCVGGECKECDNKEHCASKNCRSDKTCAPAGDTEMVVPLDGSGQGVPESSQPDESVSPDVALEPVPEAQTESAPEPQIEAAPEAACVGEVTRPCYSAGKIGCTVAADGKYTCKGRCTAGTETCNNGAWSDQCTGMTEPSAELCNNKDDDCDGQIDNGFANIGQLCEAGKGECEASGKYVCKADGTGIECSAKIGTPKVETCNGKDDDCDGQIDNGCEFQWAVSAGGMQPDDGKSIAVDSTGNLYITGYYTGTASFGTTTLTSKGNADIFVAKFR